MGIEFELKYGAKPQQLSAIRQALDGKEEIYQMQTTYYDTPAGSYSAKKCTLRRRLENQRSVCTLKTPDQGHGRREWEVECGSIEEAVEKLCKLDVPEDVLAPAKEGLIPICGARFTRIAKTLTWGESVLELALDEGFLTGGDRQMPLCEVEVELKAGTQEDCLAFARQLSENFGLQPEPDSKFRRALALYKGEIT